MDAVAAQVALQLEDNFRKDIVMEAGFADHSILVAVAVQVDL